MFVGTFVIEPADPGGWLVLVGIGFALHAAWVTVRERRECFVVTNMRVFRLHGVLSTHRATMPLHRILDITVDKPIVGRILGFGHLTFESAAQDQGLREIRYVGHPDERDLKIQRVVQVVGLRGPRIAVAHRCFASSDAKRSSANVCPQPFASLDGTTRLSPRG